MISKDSSVIEDSFQRQKGSGRIDIDLRLHAVGKYHLYLHAPRQTAERLCATRLEETSGLLRPDCREEFNKALVPLSATVCRAILALTSPAIPSMADNARLNGASVEICWP